MMTNFVLLHLILIPVASPLSFNFTGFSSDDKNITYDGAFTESNAIQLTNAGRDMARATYAKPLHLYDNSTRNLTDFHTHFSFIMDSNNITNYGDAIAFFLAPVGSRIPSRASEGGLVGLTATAGMFNSTDYPFAAVEFYIYKNSSDPQSSHVGIYLNSSQSVKNISWWGSIPDGKEKEARIWYDSVSKNLTVVFNGFRNNKTVSQSLSYVVDLREYLPSSVTFGFAAVTWLQPAVQTVLSWSFNTTLPGEIVMSSANHASNKSNRGMAIGLSVGGVVASGLVLILFVMWTKRNKRWENDDNEEIEMDGEELERGTGPRKFLYKVLAQATNKFAAQEKLGEGGFGGVYRGFLIELNTHVAVKRISRGSKQGMKEYASEVKIISRLRHRNLVQLIGWCHEGRELLLVYEFMPNGSLDSHLFGKKDVLNWASRYKIARGLASALLYLHEEWEQCVVHRDIKSCNVMLDSNFNAKLGDFGLARLIDHEKTSQTTNVAGTMGYMAPEYCTTGKASKESDMFSFGVVALEIACGRKPINHKLQENQIVLVEWVWELYGMGKLLDAADPKLFGEFRKEEMERLMIVGLWCAHPDCKLRPSIRQVIQILNFEASLPVLPLKMPEANWFVPSMTKASLTFSGGGASSSGSSKLTSSSAYFSQSDSLLYKS